MNTSEVEVDDGKSLNLNISTNNLDSDIAQRIVELEARIAMIESKIAESAPSEPAVNTEEKPNTEDDIADVEEAAATQAADEAMIEEVYEDDEDIVNLRGNLKKANRITKRRLNLANFVAKKIGNDKPVSLKEANSIMASFRKTHNVLKNKSEKWTDDLGIRQNSAPLCDNMSRINASWRKGR